MISNFDKFNNSNENNSKADNFQSEEEICMKIEVESAESADHNLSDNLTDREILENWSQINNQEVKLAWVQYCCVSFLEDKLDEIYDLRGYKDRRDEFEPIVSDISGEEVQATLKNKNINDFNRMSRMYPY